MQVFKVFELCEKAKKVFKVFKFFSEVWLYDFLANKIDRLKQGFRKYRRKDAF
jgi:hypothetical protein